MVRVQGGARGLVLQTLNQPVSGIADNNGNILFKFEAVPNGQYWTGVLSCPLSPVTGQFIATNLGVDYFGLWIANNPFGPMSLPSGQIWVQASGLVPGETYVIYFTGYVSTGEVTAPVWPMPIANTTLATVTNPPTSNATVINSFTSATVSPAGPGPWDFWETNETVNIFSISIGQLAYSSPQVNAGSIVVGANLNSGSPLYVCCFKWNAGEVAAGSFAPSGPYPLSYIYGIAGGSLYVYAPQGVSADVFVSMLYGQPIT